MIAAAMSADAPYPAEHKPDYEVLTILLLAEKKRDIPDRRILCIVRSIIR